MKLFESTWYEDYVYYERYFDTKLNKSIKKRIDLTHEWYEPRSNGLYSFVLDDSLKLEKKQGSNSKNARDKFGYVDPMYRNIRDNYWNKDAYNKNARTWYLDIETRVGVNSTGFPVPNKALEQITLIQFYDSVEDVMFVLGLRDWKHRADYEFDYEVKYVKCNNEVHLLEVFLGIFKKLDPLVIYAWAGSGFDFPYIYNRLKRIGLDPNKLSNYGNVKLSANEYQGRTEYKLVSNGHYFIDMMDVYKKFTFKPVASYSLDTISNLELGENKVPHTEYAAFDDFYTGKYIIPENPTEIQKNSKIYKAAIAGDWDEVKELAHSEFVYYGAHDAYLMKLIDDNRNLSILLGMIAEKMGVQLSDSMGTVKPWARYIANKLMQENKVMPPDVKSDDPHVVGGYVRNCTKGKHRWVLSADVNSMYPMLGMVGFNMSPETFVPKSKLPDDLKDIILSHWSRFNVNTSEIFDVSPENKKITSELLNKYNYSMGANGAIFNKDKIGLVPTMIQDIYKTRKQAKKTQFKYEQRKVLIGELIKSREQS